MTSAGSASSDKHTVIGPRLEPRLLLMSVGTSQVLPAKPTWTLVPSSPGLPDSGPPGCCRSAGPRSVSPSYGRQGSRGQPHQLAGRGDHARHPAEADPVIAGREVRPHPPVVARQCVHEDGG